MTVRVFADHHHSALYHSLQLLFEERMGWELYRPIGTSWYEEGFWLVYDHPHTVNQFLGLHQGTEVPLDVHGQPLTENERKNLHYRVEDGIYYIQDIVHGAPHRAITLEKFKEASFDIVLSSIPQHIPRFNRLISLYQPQAKHIFQVGNAWGHQPDVKNIMASTAPFPVPSGVNVVFYHQEFDLDVFRYEPPQFHNVVHSYIHYMKRPELMDQLRDSGHFPGWQWTKYGAGMDLPILEARGVADAMRRSAFTYHYKPEGDGFGHSIVSSFACGRPPIVWSPQYDGKLARPLMQDQLTCIDASRYSPHEICRLLKEASSPEKHLRMCEAAHKRFREIVDFDAEEVQLRKFLEDLK